MDDRPTSPPDRAAPVAKPRRKGLTAPLPAVVVGLGLASGPAMAQPYAVRPDTFTIPADVAAFLPVIANDTLPNAFVTLITSLPPPVGNAFAQVGGYLYTPPNGFTGPTQFTYCVPQVGLCANVTVLVVGPEVPVPAVSPLALAGLSGVLGWLGLRLRRRG